MDRNKKRTSPERQDIPILPFLRKLHEASVAIPSEAVKREPDEEADYDSLESCGHDLIEAIHAKDAKGVAAALRAGFDMLESEPHAEYSEEG